MGSESRVCFRAHTVKTCVFMAFGSGTQNKRFCGIHAVKARSFGFDPFFCADAKHPAQCEVRKKMSIPSGNRAGKKQLEVWPTSPFCLDKMRTGKATGIL